MAAETSQTLDRGLRVLRVLAEAPEGLTVTELSQQMAVNRTVVYRLISTLEQHALIRRDTRGRLFVGLGVLHLASAVQPLLRDLAVPVLRSLAEAIGCTAHLTVADGDEALALAVVEPTWTDFHVAYRIGSRHPLSAGAAGKAIGLLRRGRQCAVRRDEWRAPVGCPRPGRTGARARGTARQCRDRDPGRRHRRDAGRAAGPRGGQGSGRAVALTLSLPRAPMRAGAQPRGPTRRGHSRRARPRRPPSWIPSPG